MSDQLTFIPVRAHTEYPKTIPSADALGEVEGDDRLHYYIKGDANGKPTRASEWISTHLAEFVGIAAPKPAIIEMMDGSLVFGSRRLTGTSGMAESAATTSFLLKPTIGNDAASEIVGLQRVLSTIYAFDLFLFNDDRHFGNYLSHDDGGVRRLYAFDFSRGLFWDWPWNGSPKPHQHTRTQGRIMRSNHGFDMDAATAAVKRLGTTAPSVVEGFINCMPSDWLPTGLKAEFMTWWSGTARGARVDQLISGLNDGTLL